MAKIKINTTRADKLGKQILSIRDFLADVQNIPLNEICLDFSNYTYSPPLLSTFFSSYIENIPEYAYENISGGYLKSICFPYGIMHDKDSNWEQKLNYYSKKTYIPLIHFSTSTESDIIIQRNNIISKVGRMIQDMAKLPLNYYTGISYLLSEFTDNIVDHSNKERGWIAFQYYLKKGYVDICIADSGRGVFKSYEEYRGERDYSHIKNHMDAIDSVIKGDSTKSLNERGFGVHTSREMLIKGLKGTFIFLSGNAIMANYDLFELGCHYAGTLLTLRIPCNNIESNFNALDYVE